MSLALWWGEENSDDGGFIYFDAVTAYSQAYRGAVTKHPVDGGSSITDHFIRENPVMTLSAVITGVDISTGTYLIQDLDGNSPFNTRQAPNAVSVGSTDQSVLQKFIPDSIGQFLADNEPEITVDGVRNDLIEQVRELLINLMSGVKFNENTAQFDSNVQLVKLYEFDNNIIKKIINNLVVTAIEFREDPDSGYALFCDITLEQVTFVPLKKVEIPKRTKPVVKKKAASKATKGKADCTPQDVDGAQSGKPKADLDPRRSIADVPQATTPPSERDPGRITM